MDNQGYISANRRKILVGLTAIDSGTAAAGVKKYLEDDGELYIDEETVCYITENSDLEGKEVEFFFPHVEREDEERILNGFLEPNEEGNLEVCVDRSEINFEDYQELERVEIDDEEVYERRD